VVEVDYDVLLSVADYHEEASFLLLRDVSTLHLLGAIMYVPERHFGSMPVYGSHYSGISLAHTCRRCVCTYMAFLGILTAPQAPPLLSHSSLSQPGALVKVIAPGSRYRKVLFHTVAHSDLGFDRFCVGW
jgi:hypothetical protein